MGKRKRAPAAAFSREYPVMRTTSLFTGRIEETILYKLHVRGFTKDEVPV